MKKIFKLSSVVVGLAVFSASAGIITITPPDADMYDLDHYSAYKWNININQYAEGKGGILGVTLYIDNITNSQEPEANDILRGYILDINTPTNSNIKSNSVNVLPDNQSQNISKFFGIPSLYSANGWTNSTLIGTFTDNNGSAAVDNLSWGINLLALNQYKSDNGWIGIGLDPDCHYNNSKVRLVVNVPEPSSLSMMFFGFSLLGGFAFFRRRKK